LPLTVREEISGVAALLKSFSKWIVNPREPCTFRQLTRSVKFSGVDNLDAAQWPVTAGKVPLKVRGNEPRDRRGKKEKYQRTPLHKETKTHRHHNWIKAD